MVEAGANEFERKLKVKQLIENKWVLMKQQGTLEDINIILIVSIIPVMCIYQNTVPSSVSRGVASYRGEADGYGAKDLY
jgi:hypothetical protein